jgi:ribosomal protein L18E
LLNSTLDNTRILAKAITTISKTAENKKTIVWRKVRETLEPTRVVFGL